MIPAMTGNAVISTLTIVLACVETRSTVPFSKRRA